MKRPFAVIGITFLAALTSASVFGARAGAILACVFAAGFGVSLIFSKLRKEKTVPAVLITACAAFVLYLLALQICVVPVQSLSEQAAKLTGVICEAPYERYGKFYYELETRKIELPDVPQEIKILLSSPSPIDADFYDEVTCTAAFYKPTAGSSGRYMAKGIYLLASVQQGGKISVRETQDKPPYYYALCARKAVTDKIYTYMPSEEASLAAALLLGDKYCLDQNLKEDFNKSGTGHLIVVSGLHMAVVEGCIYFVLLKLTRRKKLAAAVSIVGILLFMALTAFTPSVMRSGIMLIVYMLAQLFNRTSDSLNSIGIAALVLTAFNPFAAGDTGLLMSFCATLGIILFFPAMDGYICGKLEKLRFGRKAVHFILSILLVSLSATVAAFPVMFYAFGSFSLYFLLSNLLLIWAAQLLLYCCLPMVLLSFAGPLSFLAFPFAFAATCVSAYMIQTAVFIAKLPYAYISMDQKFLSLWFAATLLMIAMGILSNRGFRPVKLIVPLSLVVLLCGCATFAAFQRDAVHLRVFDAGDGISAVLEKNGKTALLACGGDIYSSPLLWFYDDKPEPPDFMLVASGKRLKSYAADLTNEIDVENILLYDTSSNKTLKEDLAEIGGRIETFTDSRRVLLWNDVKLETAAIGGNVWTFVQTKQKSLLVCPDGGSFSDIPAAWRKADICIVSIPPEHVELLNAGCTVISSSEEKAPAIAQLLAPYQERLTAPAVNGDTLIQLYKP